MTAHLLQNLEPTRADQCRTRRARSIVMRLLGAVAAAVLVTPVMSRAQDEAQPPEGESRFGVYLNDSFEVRQELRVLERLEAAGNWTQAALKTQDLIAGNANQVVEREPGNYTSVARCLSERVAGWPAAGLSAYRDLYENEAHARLDSARNERDLRALSTILNQHFATSAGGQAGQLLAQYRLEAGEFDAAAFVLARLLDTHPDFRERPPLAVALYAAALNWSGEIESARRVADRERAEGGDRRLLWAGVDRSLVDVLDEVLAETMAPHAPGERHELWSGFGGNAARNQVPVSTAAVGAAVWSFPLTGGGGPPGLSAEPMAFEQTVSRGRNIDLFPAVRNKRVFAHDNARAWALDLETGGVLWTQQLAEVARDETGGETGPPSLHAPALWNDRVIVVLGSHDTPYYGSSTPTDRSVLLSLDSRTGKTVWRVEGRELSPRFATVQFDGAPVCADGKVVVVARRRKTFGFEDCLVFCFAAESGGLNWQTHIGSASAGGYGYRKPTLSAPAVAGDNVYVQSNLGTLAAIDLQTGLLGWLRVYRSRNRSSTGLTGQASTWEYNPTMVWRDRVIAAPLDRDEALIVDRKSGAFLAEIPRNELGNLQTLVGIRHDRLYFAGDHVGAWDLIQNRTAWSEPLPDAGLFGRAALVADALFVPTTGYLMRYDLDGKLIERTAWNPPEARGNVIATRGELLVAGAERITCYAQKDDAIARLRLRMESEPADPRPSLDLAEMAFRTAEYELGMDALAEAVSRTGDLFDLQDTELKRRIFDDCLTFADRLLRDSTALQSQALELYKLAAQCPPDAAAGVLYRLKMAALYSRMQRHSDAIALYQQVIADRSLRDLPVPPNWHPTVIAGARGPAETSRDRLPTCGEVARRLIDRLINQYGRDSYSPFETQARELLSRGVRLKQPALLERVTELFPNAEAAPQARLALGDLWLANGQFNLAARCYKSAKNLYGDRIDLPDVYARIIRCYLREDRTRSAADWLRNAARRFPHDRVNTEHGRLTFPEWYEREISPDQFAGPTWPRVTPPLAQAHTRHFQTTDLSILDPVFDGEPGTPHDVYLAHYKDKLMLFDPVRDLPLWDEPAECKATPRLLAFVRPQPDADAATHSRHGESGRPACMVLATQYQVFALEPRTGKRIWNYGYHPADADDPLADHESFTVLKDHALYDGRLVSLRASGRAVAHDIFTGRQLWSTDLEHAPGEGPSVLSGEFFLYHAMSEGRHIYPLLDAETGNPLHTFAPADGVGPPLGLYVLPEEIGLIVTARTIQAYDLGSFELLWRSDVDSNILAASVQVGPDGLYLSHDRRHVVKRSLYEDRQLGRSAPLVPDGRPLDGLSAILAGETLYVTSDSSATALDAADLRRLWDGTRDDRDDLIRHALTSDYLLSIGRRRDEQRLYTAYFFDRTHQSGRLAADGGALELGEFEHFRGVHVRDDCLLVVDGNTILNWVAESAWPK